MSTNTVGNKVVNRKNQERCIIPGRFITSQDPKTLEIRKLLISSGHIQSYNGYGASHNYECIELEERSAPKGRVESDENPNPEEEQYVISGWGNLMKEQEYYQRCQAEKERMDERRCQAQRKRLRSDRVRHPLFLQSLM